MIFHFVIVPKLRLRGDSSVQISWYNSIACSDCPDGWSLNRFQRQPRRLFIGGKRNSMLVQTILGAGSEGRSNPRAHSLFERMLLRSFLYIYIRHFLLKVSKCRNGEYYFKFAYK